MKRGALGARLAIGWLLVVAACAVAAPDLSASDDEGRIERLLAPPSSDHLLGTDEEGRDVVAVLMAGARTAALIGLTTVFISGMVGTLLGTLSGWYRGATDRVVTTLTEAVYAFPGILLAIFLMFLVARPGPAHVIGALSASGWATYARLARGSAMATRELPFVEAARALGLPQPALLGRHVLPQAVPAIAIQAAFGVANAILAEAALSFLGLGIADGTSWGAMLSSGAVLYLRAPALAVAPGLALALTVLAVLTLADRLQRHLDPRAAT